MNGPLKFLTARKIYLCSICSQNLNECSLARAPQIFVLLASSQSNFFYFCLCSQKNHSAPYACKCSQRPFVTPNKVPPTKSRLDCGLLLSPATTDYSRIKDLTRWFSQSAYKKCFRLQSLSTIRIFGDRDRFTEKTADFVRIFWSNFPRNQ